MNMRRQRPLRAPSVAQGGMALMAVVALAALAAAVAGLAVTMAHGRVADGMLALEQRAGLAYARGGAAEVLARLAAGDASLPVNGAPVHIRYAQGEAFVRIESMHGKVDINTAEAPEIQRVLEAAGYAEAQLLAAWIIQSRQEHPDRWPLAAEDELALLPDLPDLPNSANFPNPAGQPPLLLFPSASEMTGQSAPPCLLRLLTVHPARGKEAQGVQDGEVYRILSLGRRSATAAPAMFWLDAKTVRAHGRGVIILGRRVL